jgi:hypothetical protein
VALRGILLSFLCWAVCGQTLDDAIRTLAGKVSAHLAANEMAHLTSRNLSAIGPGDANKIHAALERTLRKRIRNPAAVDVVLTISENVRGYVLVAQVRQDIEMVAFRIEPAPARPKLMVERKMIWEQEAPILDVALAEDQMLVLDINGLTRYEHRARVESVPVVKGVSRDPRGRVEIAGQTLTISIPGAVCHGTWKALALTCENGGETRNTLESGSWAPYFSYAQIGTDHLLAQIDGRTHIYDADRKPAGTIDEWGSDFIPACSGTRILATGAGDRESRDFVALYDLTNRTPVRVSDPLEFPGPVTALWEYPARAVVRNLSTGRYEAYSLTMDCGR